jgi:hypothetical protein
MWFRFADSNGNIYFLLGVSALAGAGGTSVLDCLTQVLLRVIRSGVLTGSFTAPPEPKEEDKK